MTMRGIKKIIDEFTGKTITVSTKYSMMVELEDDEWLYQTYEVRKTHEERIEGMTALQAIMLLYIKSLETMMMVERFMPKKLLEAIISSGIVGDIRRDDPAFLSFDSVTAYIDGEEIAIPNMRIEKHLWIEKINEAFLEMLDVFKVKQ